MGKGNDRNKPCHCGSGKKQKKCCPVKYELNPTRHDKPLSLQAQDKMLSTALAEARNMWYIHPEMLEPRYTWFESSDTAVARGPAETAPVDPEKDGYGMEHVNVPEEYWEEWDGDYEKTCYWVRNEHDRIFPCWPNAGKMNSVHRWDITFLPEDNVRVYAMEAGFARIRETDELYLKQTTLGAQDAAACAEA